MSSRIAALVVALACFTPVDARAYCQTTTCNPKKEACAADERGCVTSGTPLHWPAQRTPLGFRFQRRHSSLLVPEETVAAVRAAFFRWSDVTCPDGKRTSLRFIEDEELTDDKPLDAHATRPEPFGIYFRDHGWPHASGEDQTALTTIDFAASTGAILYADIEVNTTSWLFATRDTGDGIDLQTVVTHEVGHFIGLSHSREPNTIMAAGLCDSGDRCARDRVSSRRLGADDIAAVCALYPATSDVDRSSAPSPGADSCAVSTPGEGRHGMPNGLSIACFAIAVMRHRRRSKPIELGAQLDRRATETPPCTSNFRH